MTAAREPYVDQALLLAAERIEQTGWAAELCDRDWRLVWVSSQLKTLMGVEDDATLGIGRHILESRFLLAGAGTHVQRRWLEDNVPLMLEETPGGRAALRAMVPHELAEIVERAEPSRLPAWTSVLDLREGVLPLGEVRYFAVRARSTEGRAPASSASMRATG